MLRGARGLILYAWDGADSVRRFGASVPRNFSTGSALHRGVRFAAFSHHWSVLRADFGLPIGRLSVSRSRDPGGWWTTRVAGLLVLVGLEISAGLISTTWVRLREGVGALRGGPEASVPTEQFLIGLGLTLLAGAVLILTVWRSGVRSQLAIAAPGCPDCGQETKRIRRKASHRLLSSLLGDDITRRACAQCGWVGLSKDL